MHLKWVFNEIADNCLYTWPQIPMGLGDNMRQKALPALTIIEAAGLISITHARLTWPIRDYRDRVDVRDNRDRVDVEMSATVDRFGIRLRSGPSDGVAVSSHQALLGF